MHKKWRLQNIHEKHYEIITIRDPPEPQKVWFRVHETHVFVNHLCPQKTSKWHPNGPQNETKMSPKTSRDPPKTPKKTTAKSNRKKWDQRDLKTWLAQWTGSAFRFGIAKTAWRTSRSSIHTSKLWNTESDSMPLSLTALDEHDLPATEETPTRQSNGPQRYATKWSSPTPSAQSRPREGRQVAALWKLGHLSFCFQHIPSGLWIR